MAIFVIKFQLIMVFLEIDEGVIMARMGLTQ